MRNTSKQILFTCLFLFAWTGTLFANTPLPLPIALVAGDGTPGYKDGDFSSAEFNGLAGLLLDDEQNILYAAEGTNAAIRMIHLDQANQVTTLVGKNGPGAQDGAFGSCKIKAPAQMIWGEKSKTIFFSDAGNHQIKKLDLTTGTCSTLCGNPLPGFKDGRGSEAQFNNPQGLLLLRPASKLLVADTGNAALRLVDIKTGDTQTLFKSSLLQKMEFQFCFFDTKPDLILTCKNKPGFWRLLQKSKAPLNNSDLSAINENFSSLDLQPDLFLPADSEITACTTNGITVCFSLKQAEFDRQTSPLRLVNLYTLDKPNTMDYQAWLPQVTSEMAAGSVTKTAHPLQSYRLFDTANGLAYHPVSEQIFVSDEANHRIISIRINRSGEFFRGTFYPPKKPAGVKRILLFGNSLNYVIVDRPVESEQNLELPDSLSKRIEYWLNVIALSKGSPQRYEVIYGGGAMFYSAPSVAYAFYNLFAVEKLQIDLVLYNYTYFDIIFDAVRYLQTPYAQGELQHHDFDPEFFLTPIKKRSLHPLGRELLDYIVQHPEKLDKFIKYSPGARDITTIDNTSADILYDEENRNIFFKLAADELKKYREHLDAYNLKTSRHVPLVINLIPLPINLFNNEILYEFRQGAKTKPDFLAAKLKPWCAENAIEFQDTMEMTRLLDPSIFPLFSFKNFHYSARTADLVAFFTANQLLDKIK
jgi:hypothetical protein